jgi:hypothetical protein
MNGCTKDDGLYRLYVIQSVARGLHDVEHGRTTSHAQVAAELRQKRQRKADQEDD